jgi:hypothetical protein
MSPSPFAGGKRFTRNIVAMHAWWELSSACGGSQPSNALVQMDARTEPQPHRLSSELYRRRAYILESVLPASNDTVAEGLLILYLTQSLVWKRRTTQLSVLTVAFCHRCFSTMIASLKRSTSVGFGQRLCAAFGALNKLPASPTSPGL